MSALRKATDKGGRKETMNQRVKLMARTSSLSEKPRSQGPRRLAEWLNPTGAKKVHSLPNTFISIAPRAHLCESWMRETRTSSLSGGRRPAFWRLLRPDSPTPAVMGGTW